MSLKELYGGILGNLMIKSLSLSMILTFSFQEEIGLIK